MTARDTSLRDDHVDDEIAECLQLDTPRSFFLYAGAGSGKTRSLVQALRHIERTSGLRLVRHGQHVAVITYTNAACDEIQRRVGFNLLFHVSTIHSFAWDLVSGYDQDIRLFLTESLKSEIDELQAAEASGRTGTKASVTRLAKIKSKQERLEALPGVRRFIYSPTGDNRERNALGHAEVIAMCAAFLHKPLMRRILVSRFPFLLIDESQDTNALLVDALLEVQTTHSHEFALGLIGDTMQRIYADGKEGIETELPVDWAKPAKVLNHRSPARIVRLINQVRSAADDHAQEARDDAVEGIVRMFVFEANSADRFACEAQARSAMANLTGDEEWVEAGQCMVLTLEHRMAATRLGFTQAFDALYSISRFKTGLLDGTLPVLRFFANDVLPIADAHAAGDRFEVARLVRERSPIISKDALKSSTNPAMCMHQARAAVESLTALWDNEVDPTLATVAGTIATSGLLVVPEDLLVALAAMSTIDDGALSSGTDPLATDISALVDFLSAPFTQVRALSNYLSGNSSFGTHQGVKGLEFDRVMVILDDSEAKGFMFAYDKLLGAKPMTKTDEEHLSAGRETSLDRTRRLLYVTCSRAKRSLALVVYSNDPAAAAETVLGSGWLVEGEIEVG